jgi:hypothetical protein
LAPFSGSAVLKSVCTPSNGLPVAPGGSTLPTVIVRAWAALAANSATALITAITPRLVLRRCFI